MKRLSVVTLCILLFALQASFAEEATMSAGLKELNLQDCAILRTFYRVWKYSPLMQREKATWIVINSAGGYEAVDWHDSTLRKTAVWSDILPKNIIAQAHTHSDHVDPKPSEQDVYVARSLNIWVYTLTRKGIWRAGPDGQVTQQMDHNWFRKTEETCGK